MRAAVVYFAPQKNSRIGKMAASLAEGIKSQGQEVDLIDGMTEQSRKLIMYQYIAIGTEQISFFGKINDKIGQFLASQGTVQGKKSFAFVVKHLAGSAKALLRLMGAMEKEGLVIRSSEIFSDYGSAIETGKKLHISI